MRGIVRGTVVEVEDSSYTNAQGQKTQQSNVYVRQEGSSDRYGADRINCRPEHVVEVGSEVEYVVNFTARTSKAGKEYLSVYALDVRTAPALSAVG